MELLGIGGVEDLFGVNAIAEMLDSQQGSMKLSMVDIVEFPLR